MAEICGICLVAVQISCSYGKSSAPFTVTFLRLRCSNDPTSYTSFPALSLFILFTARNPFCKPAIKHHRCWRLLWSGQLKYGVLNLCKFFSALSIFALLSHVLCIFFVKVFSTVKRLNKNRRCSVQKE